MSDFVFRVGDTVFVVPWQTVALFAAVGTTILVVFLVILSVILRRP